MQNYFYTPAQEYAMTDHIRDIILSTVEASLEAQLRAVRRLRQGPTENTQAPRKQSRSQVDMAYDILKKTRTPLHVSEIIDRIQTQFGVAIDRESLVSSLRPRITSWAKFSNPEVPLPTVQTFGGVVEDSVANRRFEMQLMLLFAVSALLLAVLHRVMSSVLFAVSPYDSAWSFGAVGILVAMGTIACLLPARRAAAVDPMQALRRE
jgi:hypothetical protein